MCFITCGHGRRDRHRGGPHYCASGA
jgi:hypothetical protein